MEEIMDPKQIAKQMVDFNKTAFDNSFDAMSVIQDQAEKMISAAMEQTAFSRRKARRLLTSGSKQSKKAARNSRPQLMRISKKWKSFSHQNSETL